MLPLLRRTPLMILLILILILSGVVCSVRGQSESGQAFLPVVQASDPAACTLYASPSGSDANSGDAPSSPLTLKGAYRKTRPGDTVCLLPGTYDLDAPVYISKGGTAEAYITYTSYDPTKPALLNWASSAAKDIFQVNNSASYIKVQGLEFDGNNIASAGIKCNTGSHHIVAISNTIANTGSSGFASVRCDYLTIDGNKIHHTGYGAGNSSGISLNQSIWFDQAAGFHSVVVNNIIAGSYDNSPDNGGEGNGITMDREGNTPPVLIANNLVYMNAARCIIINYTSNKWVINNTCYANSLDSHVEAGTGSTGEYMTNYATNVYFANNAVLAWGNGYAFKQHQSSEITYDHNAYYGGKGLWGIPSTVASDPKQLRKADPLFVNPFTLDPSADGQYRNAPHPDQIGPRFQLQFASSLINAGMDPRAIPGLTAEFKAGIETYLLTDLAGTPRPQGSDFDIGAYEYR